VRGYGGSLWKICAKMVPRLLNEGQKEQCVQVCWDILEQLETEPNLLKRVVTGDESWIFEYDPLTKCQSLEWKSELLPRPKKVKMFKYKTKVMLIAFFDVHGIVYAEFLPQGQIINQRDYKTSCNVRCAQWGRKENCGKRGHGYSPDLAPCDFFLFPKLKEVEPLKQPW